MNIVQLPLSPNSEAFQDDLRFILKSKHLSKDQKTYLEKKSKSSEKWAKCFMKNYFCSGMCTSSRVEAKHRLYKKFFNSSTQLTEFFKVIQELEQKEISSFKDEVKRFSQKETKKLNGTSLIKYFEEEYSSYAITKLKDELIESINYKLSKKDKEKWYINFFLF